MDVDAAQAPGHLADRLVHVVAMTYRRPDHLEALLPLLVAQAQAATDGRTTVVVLIVDNDPDASARDTVRARQRPGAQWVQYVHEPKPGIPAARNAALAASEDADVVVFIDDDERPAPDWLSTLLAAYDRFGTAAVVGPVLSVYEEPPPEWTVAGRFWDRRRLVTGTRVDVADTNNLLLDMHILRGFGLRFDESLRMGGGSDNLLTRQLVKAGGEIVWCDEAVVYDQVAPERTRPRWLARRRFAMSANRVVVALKLADSVSEQVCVRLRFAAAGTLVLLGGAATWVGGTVVRRLKWRAVGARRVIRGAGMVAGALGHHGQQYARGKPDGQPRRWTARTRTSAR